MGLHFIKRLGMVTTIGTFACAALVLSASPAFAGDDHDNDGRGRHGHHDRCKDVSGKATWTLIPAPNDPLGRVLGPTTGDLKAAVSAYLTSLAPQSDGTLKAESVETWVLGAQDIIQFAGVATFTPIANAPIGTVRDALTLTVIGGSGDFANATGALQVRGIGYNIFGPGAGPGSSFFEVRYSGQICKD